MGDAVDASNRVRAIRKDRLPVVAEGSLRAISAWQMLNEIITISWYWCYDQQPVLISAATAQLDATHYKADPAFVWCAYAMKENNAGFALVNLTITTAGEALRMKRNPVSGRRGVMARQ